MMLLFFHLERTETVKVYLKKYTFRNDVEKLKILFQKLCTNSFGIYQQECGHFGIFIGGIVDERIWLSPYKHKRAASGSGN